MRDKLLLQRKLRIALTTVDELFEEEEEFDWASKVLEESSYAEIVKNLFKLIPNGTP